MDDDKNLWESLFSNGRIYEMKFSEIEKLDTQLEEEHDSYDEAEDLIDRNYSFAFIRWFSFLPQSQSNFLPNFERIFCELVNMSYMNESYFRQQEILDRENRCSVCWYPSTTEMKK